MKQQLKVAATQLKPIILIGNKGLTPAVQKEVGCALLAHELIKIRFQSQDREERAALTNAICEFHDAVHIHSIGRVGVVYKRRPDQH